MAENIQTFSGTRDISGDDMLFKQHVMDIIRKTFEEFGFEPLETPVLERKETLLGKYGEEAENLLFMLADPYEGGLRYDHTVPLARFAAAKWQQLATPYKRYAIGPVFRGEKPQKGRYRQFIQCDFDTLGSNSPLVDAEIAAMNYSVLTKLGFKNNFEIHLNDRRLLNALLEELEFKSDKDKQSVLRAWDKLDKQSLKEVVKYLKSQIKDIKDFEEMTLILLKADLSDMKKKFKSQSVKQELDRIESLISMITELGVPEDAFRFNPLLARGLSYYTGPIFETVVTKSGIGSISGGGRYDNLIGVLGGPDVPASGSSFGIDRLLDVIQKLGLRPESNQKTQVLVTIFSQEMLEKSVELASKLRGQNINVEIYSGDKTKIGDQIKYADKKQIPFVAVIGPDEYDKKVVALKNMSTGEQKTLDTSKVATKVS